MVTRIPISRESSLGQSLRPPTGTNETGRQNRSPSLPPPQTNTLHPLIPPRPRAEKLLSARIANCSLERNKNGIYLRF
jgi:hypothetical protein